MKRFYILLCALFICATASADNYFHIYWKIVRSNTGRVKPVFYMEWPDNYVGNNYDVRVYFNYHIKYSWGMDQSGFMATIYGVSGKYEHAPWSSEDIVGVSAEITGYNYKMKEYEGALFAPEAEESETMNSESSESRPVHRPSSVLTMDNYMPHYSKTSVEAVDLGLSVLWANCNLGASSIDEEGELYGWGEVQPRPYLSYRKEKKIKKEIDQRLFASQREYGNILPPDLDAAHYILGDHWRMPSYSEFQELCWKCDIEWTNINGTYGYKFTSRVPGFEGKSIFIPKVQVFLLGEATYMFWYHTTDWKYRDSEIGPQCYFFEYYDDKPNYHLEYATCKAPIRAVKPRR